MKHLTRLEWTVLAVFWTAALLYGVNDMCGKPYLWLSCIVKMLPVLSMSIMAAAAGKWKFSFLPLGLYFAAFGDLAGELDEFIFQVAAFAIAQISYTTAFFERAVISRKRITAFCILLAVCFIAGITIVSSVDSLLEKVMCTGYIALITMMASSTVFQRCPRSLGYCVGAVAFIASDIVIGVNRFITPVEHETFIIMFLYFLSQFIFGFLYIKELEEGRSLE